MFIKTCGIITKVKLPYCYVNKVLEMPQVEHRKLLNYTKYNLNTRHLVM